MKSEDKNFAYGDRYFSAIDNGSQVTRFTHYRLEICQFPTDLVLSIHGAVTDDPFLKQQMPQKISERRMEVFKEDVFSKELLEQQPEAFKELDGRVHKLACLVKQCQQDGRLIIPPGSSINRPFSERNFV